MNKMMEPVYQAVAEWMREVKDVPAREVFGVYVVGDFATEIFYLAENATTLEKEVFAIYEPMDVLLDIVGEWKIQRDSQ